MSSSINNVTLVGNLGQDPDGGTTNSGEQFAKFSLATSRYAKNGEEPKTDWHRIVVFGSAAEACSRYLHKGAMVAVVGRIQYGEYTDKEDIRRFTTDIIASTVQFLKTDKDEQGKSHSGKAPAKKENPSKGGGKWGGSSRHKQDDEDVPL